MLCNRWGEQPSPGPPRSSTSAQLHAWERSHGALAWLQAQPWGSAEQGHFPCLDRVCPSSSHLTLPKQTAGGLALLSFFSPFPSPCPCPCSPSPSLSTCRTSPRASAPAESCPPLPQPSRQTSCLRNLQQKRTRERETEGRPHAESAAQPGRSI